MKRPRMPAQGQGTRELADVVGFASMLNLEDGKTPFLLEPWQSEFVTTLLHSLTPEGHLKYRRALLGISRKNGKTTLGAFIALVDTLFPREPYPETLMAAGDKEQAHFLLTRLKRFIECSPSIRDRFVIFKDAVEDRKNGGLIRAISTDVTIHGHNASLVLIDEAWQFPDYVFLESLAPSLARQEPLTVMLSYAGHQHQMRKGHPLFDAYSQGIEGSDPTLLFRWFSGPTANPASWVTQRRLEEMRRAYPSASFRRMFLNEWAQDESALLSPSEIANCIGRDLANTDRGTGHLYFIGADLGLVEDKTAVCVVHLDPVQGLLFLDHLKTWQGTRARPVQLGQVEQHIKNLCANFSRVGKVYLDQWQGIQLEQRLREAGCPVEVFYYSGSNINKMAVNAFRLFKDGKFRMPVGCDALVEEMQTAVIKEMPYGWKLTHPPGQHDDCLQALSMAALGAMESPVHYHFQKVATIREGYGGLHSVVELDGQQIARFALDDDGGVRAILQGEQAATFADREQFAAALRSQHGGLRFVAQWS